MQPKNNDFKTKDKIYCSSLKILQMTSEKFWDYEMLFNNRYLWSNKFQKLWICPPFAEYGSQNFTVKKQI